MTIHGSILITILFLIIALLTWGCTPRYMYTTDGYLEHVIEMCEGRVAKYEPRSGKVTCFESAIPPTQINGGG